MPVFLVRVVHEVVAFGEDEKAAKSKARDLIGCGVGTCVEVEVVPDEEPAAEVARLTGQSAGSAQENGI
jgi:hypothetical protein